MIAGAELLLIHQRDNKTAEDEEHIHGQETVRKSVSTIKEILAMVQKDSQRTHAPQAVQAEESLCRHSATYA
jgi:hypothetical protein